MRRGNEIKIHFKTAPPKRELSEEEFDNLLNKSISLIVDELIIKGTLEIGN